MNGDDCACGDLQSYKVLTDALLLALREVQEARTDLDNQTVQIVIELRRLNVYWREIGEILGVSRLVAARRYLPYIRGAAAPPRYDLEDDGESDGGG